MRGLIFVAACDLKMRGSTVCDLQMRGLEYRHFFMRGSKLREYTHFQMRGSRVCDFKMRGLEYGLFFMRGSMSPDPKRCSVNVKSTDIHTVVTFERPCVPPKTQRQSIRRLPPVPNPMSFRRYAWPFKSYRGIGV